MDAIADVSAPILLLAPALFIIATGAIVLLEAIVFRLLKWKPFALSVKDSLLTNFASTVIGLSASLIFAGSSVKIPIGIVLAIGYAMSVVAEGMILDLLKKSATTKRAWLVAAVANLASYSILAFIAGQQVLGIIAAWAFIVSIVLLTPTTHSDKEDMKQTAARPGE